MEIHPLHPRFAAEITGLDLARPLDAATLEVVHDAFLEHAVLLFRGQHLSPAQQAGFAQALAAIEAPLIDRRSMVRPPALRVAAGGWPGEVPPGAVWHADHTAAAEPTLACIAHAIPGQPATGAIAFADQRAALGRLSPALRRRAEALRGEHRAEDGGRAEHPLVRSHPVTGEAALFVNPLATARVLNLGAVESDALLARLFAAATAEVLTWRHAWAPGDLLLWDNRVVLHTGSPDPSLQRSRIEGDRPLGAGVLDMPWVSAG